MVDEKKDGGVLLEEDQGKSAEEENTRRILIKRGGIAFAVAVAGGIGAVCAFLKGGTASAAQKDKEDQRVQFAEEARSVLQKKGNGSNAALLLTEEELANLGDRSGKRASAFAIALPEVTAHSSASVLPPQTVENILRRMQQDLQRALQKPVEQRGWGMVLDLRKCIGCSACTVACKAENKLPPGVVYRPVLEEEIGKYPHVSRKFTPRPCMQCDNPPCVPVCPVGATYKRPDGVVEINYNTCIGCRYCIAACPYGARTFDWGLTYTEGTAKQQAYELEPSSEYGQSWPRKKGVSPVNNARKCQFCLHRLAEGMLPACTTTCVGGATYFGDLKDSESLVSELVARPNVLRLKEELGTKPRTYYLV